MWITLIKSDIISCFILLFSLFLVWRFFSTLWSSLVFVTSQPSSDSPYSSGFFLKMQLEIMTLQSLQPWYHGKGELQCAEQKNKRFRGVKKKKKDKEKAYANFVAGKREIGMVLGGNFTHLLKPHMYQLRLTSISTAYQLSYLYLYWPQQQISYAVTWC